MNYLSFFLGIVFIVLAVLNFSFRKKRLSEYRKIRKANLGKVHLWFHPAWTYFSVVLLVIVGVILVWGSV